MTIKQWLESPWTKLASRAAIIATPLLIAGFAGAWGIVTRGVAIDLTAAKAEIVSVRTVQDTRASDSEAFQREVRAAVAGVNKKVDAVDDKVYQVSVDVGVIKRLVTELRNQDVASAAVLPSNRHAWQPTPQALR